ncbi:phosphotransferase [Asanoa iriomotensis]|uniref:Aminoglycoside phosphotransferase domain-containing protein n=1 Tax=Asanoa iriomotensis TaxID=234613 RepID=A0ABQ4C314_9ACTN|nr:phosphotransferase [Asanoa iriomotensis]GIF57167.1 hypothetical protein Air01nite_32620 [Asanoa iriomotensis]
MRDRPAGLPDQDVIAGLRAGWGIQVREAGYLPLGAGSYHWSVVADDGQRWFVTIDDHGADADALDRALTTALTLHDKAGLDFVVAPVETRGGRATWRLSPRYTASVFPLLDGVGGAFGPHRPQDRGAVVAMLATLHRATPAVDTVAARADLDLPDRDELTRTLADLDVEWHSGPFAEPARALLKDSADRIEGWLADHDRLVAEVRTSTRPWVVTHGEPHPGNVVRTNSGLRLVDWDTARLAPPERDLWLVTSDADLLARYTEATGLTVSPTAMDMFRLRWKLADIAAFVGDLRRPHGAGEDPAAALHYLTGYLRDR